MAKNKRVPRNAKLETKKVEDNQPTNQVSMEASDLVRVSNSTKARINNNKTILELFPDVEASIQIMTSLITTPLDMKTTIINYDLDSINLPSVVETKVLSTLDKSIKTNYKLEKKLYNIVREALYTKGSYIEAIIPENAITNMLQSDVLSAGIESINTALGNDYKGIIGKSKKDTMECTKLVEVYDNPSMLFSSKIQANYNRSKIMSSFSPVYNRMNLGLENKKESVDTLGLLYNTYKTTFGKVEKTKEFINLSAKGVKKGKPIMMKLPVESVIPIHLTGAPEEHLGYFVLLNDKGVPIKDPKNWNTVDDLSNHDFFNKTEILHKAQKNIKGITNTVPVLKDVEDAYFSILEEKLYGQLQEGMYSDNLTISDNSDIKKILFNRLLANQGTKIVYLPKEMIVNYTFNFRENGTGESILEKILVLSSIRGMLLFSDIMGAIKNAIPGSDVHVTLDPNDSDPAGTKALIESEFFKKMAAQFPIGITSIEDHTDYITKVGYRFIYEQENGPKMSIEEREKATVTRGLNNSELEERIQKLIVMSLGPSQEMIDSSYQSNFAITVAMNNTIVAKKVNTYKTQLSEMMTEHIRSIMLNDTGIFETIRLEVENNLSAIRKDLKATELHADFIKTEPSDDSLVNYIIMLIIENINVTVPMLDMREEDPLLEKFDNYNEMLTRLIEMLCGDEMFMTDIAGEGPGKIDEFKMVLKNMLLKDWLTKNGYFDEVSNLLNLDKNGNTTTTILDDYTTLMTTMNTIYYEFLKTNGKMVAKNNKKLSKLEDRLANASEEEDEMGNTDDTGGEEENTDDTGMDDTGETEENTDDLGMDDTGEGEEDTGETETEEDNPDEETTI
jgi:hypothetical protein